MESANRDASMGIENGTITLLSGTNNKYLSSRLSFEVGHEAAVQK